MLSVVLPARNAALSIGPLIAEIEAALIDFKGFEIIVVDDGSTDNTVAAVEAAPSLRTRLIRHDRAGGQSAALHSGVKAARHHLVLTLDAGGQDPPGALPAVAGVLLADSEARIGLVAGQRHSRKDRLLRRAAAAIGNRLRSALLRDGTRDAGCGIRALRRDAFLDLPYFDHMHLFLPALFRGAGWQVRHVDVGHRPQLSPRSHDLGGRAGLIDLFGVLWLLSRRKKARPVTLTAPPVPARPPQPPQPGD